MTEYKLVETSKLFMRKSNVRRVAGDVTELTKSIEEKGVLEPIIVRPSKGKYEVVVGLRRFQVSKAAGLKKIPAVIREMNDDEAITMSLVENLQRKDIEAEEEYDGLTALRRLNSKFYGTQEQLAKVIGKSREHVRDVITGVETMRALKRSTGKKMEVKYHPIIEIRKKEGMAELFPYDWLIYVTAASLDRYFPFEDKKSYVLGMKHLPHLEALLKDLIEGKPPHKTPSIAQASNSSKDIPLGNQ